MCTYTFFKAILSLSNNTLGCLHQPPQQRQLISSIEKALKVFTIANHPTLLAKQLIYEKLELEIRKSNFKHSGSLKIFLQLRTLKFYLFLTIFT